MAGKGDGSDSRYSQGPPGNELEDDATLNVADVTLTTADQSTAIAVDLSTTEGLTSPHNLPTPNQQTARLCSTVVVPTPDAPLKMGRDSTDKPETLSKNKPVVA
ncbi:hypothetical protein LWI29_007105 [Acer saccharum]|uniref:Uncharacterized protein n=1 Tax=Acer saccharum TaxID=4024 RepID=A0AA39VT38_ACESA|nr:hypothetical protein LWI29_007105 [Acer saccharum]